MLWPKVEALLKGFLFPFQIKKIIWIILLFPIISNRELKQMFWSQQIIKIIVMQTSSIQITTKITIKMLPQILIITNLLINR